MKKKLKDIVKINPEPARGTVGVNPMDPWSAKANIAEAASLNQYLLSRGINPKFVSTETKISHAKSSHFLKWKQDHKFEEVETEDDTLNEDPLLDKFLSSRGINPKYATKEMKISHSKSGQFLKWKRDHLFEAVDKADAISFDIPLFIRMLELAREDVKDDMELHRITERLISIRNKGILTMDDYDFIAGIKKLKEELEELGNSKETVEEQETKFEKIWKKIAQKRSEDLRTYQLKVNEANSTKVTSLDKFRIAAAEREKKHNDIEKDRQEKLHQDPSKVSIPEPKANDGMTSAIDRLEKHLNKEEVIAEMDKTQTPPGRDGNSVSDPDAGKKQYTGKPVKSTKAKKDILKLLNKNFNKEDVFQDPQAATQTVFDGGNNTDDTSDRKSQLSKSARIIKSIYRHLNMKEDLNDWEKEDKSVESPGKKPKVKETKAEDNLGDNKPDARIVMSGGKTLTGEKRDTIEVDPALKQRQDLNGSVKTLTTNQEKK